MSKKSKSISLKELMELQPGDAMVNCKDCKDYLATLIGDYRCVAADAPIKEIKVCANWILQEGK